MLGRWDSMSKLCQALPSVHAELVGMASPLADAFGLTVFSAGFERQRQTGTAEV